MHLRYNLSALIRKSDSADFETDLEDLDSPRL